MSIEEANNLPLTEYKYTKSGKTTDLSRPKINGNHYDSVQFKSKHFSLDNLSDENKAELQRIKHELQSWVRFIKDNQRKDVNSFYVNESRLLQFTEECINHIDASIILDKDKVNSWENRHLFVLSFSDPEKIFQLDQVTAGISYCWHCFGRNLFIYQSLVNPNFQLRIGGDITIRGSGRAMKEGIMNFIEGSETFDTVSSIPINSISAYLNYTLGFKPIQNSQSDFDQLQY